MKIKPLTHKMKNRVREHGDAWEVLRNARDGTLLITPRLHLIKDEPYCVWVTAGVDIEIVE